MIVDSNGKQKNEHKLGTVTQKKMLSLSNSAQYSTLCAKVLTNLESLYNQISYVSTLPLNERMFRIGSNVLPMYDHKIIGKLYDDNLMSLIKSKLQSVGDLARNNDIRLSMHPDQFCVLNSDKPEVVKNSLLTLNMHATIAEFMGFGKEFQDFKINVHLNGRTDNLPVDDFSEVVKNCLTLENDEKKGTTDRVLNVCHTYGLAMVFDIHHHWCNTEGTYMSVDSDTVDSIISTWKNVRPTMHLSQSTSAIWSDSNNLPDMQVILKEHKRGKTFAHSQLIDNQALVNYMSAFNDKFDIMIESKLKNQSVKHFKSLMRS